MILDFDGIESNGKQDSIDGNSEDNGYINRNGTQNVTEKVAVTGTAKVTGTEAGENITGAAAASEAEPGIVAHEQE